MQFSCKWHDFKYLSNTCKKYIYLTIYWLNHYEEVDSDLMEDVFVDDEDSECDNATGTYRRLSRSTAARLSCTCLVSVGPTKV